MESFDKLFKDAKNVSDKRKKEFNRLIEKTKKDILPAFAEACKELDYSKIGFSLETPTFSGMTQDYDYHIAGNYHFVIDVNDNDICESYVKFNGENWEHESRHGATYHNFEDVPLLRTGILEFVQELNRRLQGFVSKRERENQAVSELT